MTKTCSCGVEATVPLKAGRFVEVIQYLLAYVSSHLLDFSEFAFPNGQRNVSQSRRMRGRRGPSRIYNRVVGSWRPGTISQVKWRGEDVLI